MFLVTTRFRADLERPFARIERSIHPNRPFRSPQAAACSPRRKGDDRGAHAGSAPVVLDVDVVAAQPAVDLHALFAELAPHGGDVALVARE